MNELKIKGTILEIDMPNIDGIKLFDNSRIKDLHKQIDEIVKYSMNLGDDVLKSPKILSKFHKISEEYHSQYDVTEKFLNRAKMILTKYYNMAYTDDVYNRFGRVDTKYTKAERDRLIESHESVLELNQSLKRISRAIKLIEDQSNNVLYNWVKSINAAIEYQKYINGA